VGANDQTCPDALVPALYSAGADNGHDQSPPVAVCWPNRPSAM
jgi:hypothetical protein